MNSITLNAYAKINIALDVLGQLDNGYHDLRMIMQQVDLADRVKVTTVESDEPCNRPQIELVIKGNEADASLLPPGRDNLAYRAAELMIQASRELDTGIKQRVKCTSKINIELTKNIPVAAGLAGGSSNGAAVVLALNHLWGLRLTLEQMQQLGATMGADVPFCMAGQAKGNEVLGMSYEEQASYCCEATHDGTVLSPIEPLKAWIVLCKPPIGISTAEVYSGIDEMPEEELIDIDSIISAIKNENLQAVADRMDNDLERYTLIKYPIVKSVKDIISACPGVNGALMSGSGPTVFGICSSRTDAIAVSEQIRHKIDEKGLFPSMQGVICVPCPSLC